MNPKKEQYFIREITKRLNWYEAYLDWTLPMPQNVNCTACCIFKDIKPPKCNRCPIEGCNNSTIGEALIAILDNVYKFKIADVEKVQAAIDWYIDKLEKAGYTYG